ncbi:hypothetical protein N7457_005406 [Penicillium paradoxum]|uniref:uncharacterized protein n=1 Tax=Penicillium paradoxum TaxID=176176 RepID=UPI002549AAC9|nr:uncharacterized protein N7457_005406 [Penicillium paradoxum]KAJ5780246.1 hypothetical protein N7457_005406 [Penicillium paradoxum]
MVELDDSATQHGAQDIEGLPPSVNVYRYKDMNDFCQVMSLERYRLNGPFRAAGNTRAQATDRSCEGRQGHLTMLPQTECTQSDHTIFIIEPSTFAHDFLNPLADLPFRSKISYSPETNLLVVKMPRPAHEQATRAFENMLKSALQPMALDRAIYCWGSTTLTGADGTTKEADGGWSPRRPPPRAPKRPSIVLEVGSSQNSAKLRRDAHYWVDPGKGQANMAITVKIHPTKPQINIDSWEWSFQSSRAIQHAHSTISKSESNILFDPNQPAPHLLIPFEFLFRREVKEPREGDVLLPTQELIEFATLVWEMQFENEPG